jgi:hypothetical protein
MHVCRLPINNQSECEWGRASGVEIDGLRRSIDEHGVKHASCQFTGRVRTVAHDHFAAT